MLKSERCITLSSIVRWASGKKHCIINNKKSITFIVITFWDIKLLHFEVLSQVVRWWCHHLRTHSRSKQQHVISQSLWLQYMRICVLYSYFVSFLKVVLVPLWAFTSHMAFYQKYFGGASSPNTYVLSVVLENNIKNSSGSLSNFSRVWGQRVFQISATTFADTSLWCYYLQLS